MKCPKCGYHSFEYLDACKKCHGDLTAFKSSHKITPLIQPKATAPTTASFSPQPQTSNPLLSVQEDFLIDNPAIVMATTNNSGGPEYGELSFADEAPVLPPETEPMSWDSPKIASAMDFDNRHNLQDLPDLFGDQPDPRREQA